MMAAVAVAFTVAGFNATVERVGYRVAMGTPTGFDYTARGDQVVISHHGRVATILRGAKASAFLAQVDSGDPQLLMAKLTGNYRRGNERTGSQHPRNRGR